MAESADLQDGIRNRGTLTLQNSTVSGNLAKPVCRGALPVFVRRPHCCERRAGNVFGAEVIAPGLYA